MKTHQDIINELEGLNAEAIELFLEKQKHLNARRQALRAECAVIGHVYANDKSFLGGIKGAVRVCVFCGADEPRTA